MLVAVLAAYLVVLRRFYYDEKSMVWTRNHHTCWLPCRLSCGLTRRLPGGLSTRL